jgi:peptidoglycan/LPS O-acetylase OafA/YrhL
MVIFYHTQRFYFDDKLNFLKGGFIGVDIFFVISGYLITRIILSDLISYKKFSIKEFYFNRIRRVVPLLFFLTFILFPIVNYLFIPNLVEDFSRSSLSLLTFNSNLYFYLSGLSYQAYDSIIKPLLHTWSLSVEIQFYILYPILLLFLNKFFKSHIFFFILFILLISLFVSTLGSYKFSSLNFYLLPTRVWEFLAGALVAHFKLKKTIDKNFKLKLYLPFIGLILIFLSFFFINENNRHPSLITIFVVLGTCLVIYSSDNKDLITKILSYKLIVFIGEISYSLYLLHFPILLFGKILDIKLNYLFFLIILIFFLSILTYIYIEKPARDKRISFNKICLTIIFLGASIILVNFYSLNQKGFLDKYTFANYKINKLEHLSYHNKLLSDLRTKIISNDKNNILIVGNSHGFDFANILEKTSLSNQYNFLYNKSGIHIQLSEFYDFLEKSEVIEKKYKLKEYYNKSSVIIIATKWREEDLDIVEKVIESLVSERKKIIIISHSLESRVETIFDLNRLDSFVFEKKRIPNQSEMLNIEKSLFSDFNQLDKKNITLKKIANKYSIPFFDQKSSFCDIKIEKCAVLTNDGFAIYWDYGHLTEKGYEYLSQKIEKNNEILNFFRSNFR